MVDTGSVVRSKRDAKSGYIIILKKGTQGVVLKDLGIRHPEWGRKWDVQFDGHSLVHEIYEDDLEEVSGTAVSQIIPDEPAHRNEPSQEKCMKIKTCTCPACQDNPPVGPQDEETIRKWSQLERILLNLGGERVVRRPHEPNISELLVRGKLFTEPVSQRSGQRNECHSNAAKLWGKEVASTQLVTGYALREGLWRQHSWVMRDGGVIETTVEAEKYFGIVLNDVEAVYFWYVNVKPLESHYPQSMDRVEKEWPEPMGLYRANAREVLAKFQADIDSGAVSSSSFAAPDSVTSDPNTSDTVTHQGINFSRRKMGNRNGRVNLNIERLQADGYTEDEILRIQEYCNAAMKAGRFDCRPTLTMLNHARALCCRTLTEIMDKVRPGVWLDRKRKPWYSKRSRPKKAGR